MSVSTIEDAIVAAADVLGYQALRPKQQEAVHAFVSGHDVFVSLPTGSGKSLCYTMLPIVFDRVRGLTDSPASILIVVSPLISLMKDQMNSLRSKGLSAVYAGDAREEGKLEDVRHGKCQILLISPESLLTSFMWREMLCSQEFSNLGEVRSVVRLACKALQ